MLAGLESRDSQAPAGGIVLAMAADRPVCSARVEFSVGTDFASLWGGGTLPEWRGRGIYRELVSYRARLAAEHGYRYLQVGGARVQVLHTPGHAPGAVCFWVPDHGILFSGDTLFQGGPGATGRSFSDYPTILSSIRQRLFALPPETVVHTGHGPDTTIAREAPSYDEWVRRRP